MSSVQSVSYTHLNKCVYVCLFQSKVSALDYEGQALLPWRPARLMVLCCVRSWVRVCLISCVSAYVCLLDVNAGFSLFMSMCMFAAVLPLLCTCHCFSKRLGWKPTQSTHTLRCTSARLIIVLFHSCKAHYNCAIVYVVIRNAQYIVTHVFKNVTASVAKLKIRTEI